jgi:heat-inducible transcriptional repressor
LTGYNYYSYILAHEDLLAMSFSNLTDREKFILKALIDHYILSAEPVGSTVLAQKCGLNLSSATIRNIIKDLEERELVKQPHTSAGRIPTTLGYRLYVDYLLCPEKLTKSDKEKIQTNINLEYTGIDQVLEQTSRVLGNVSRQLGITISPRFESGVLTRLELIPVADRRVMVVLAMKSGLARTVLLEVETELKEKGLVETATILNELLCGLTIGEIRSTIKERLATPTSGDPHLIKMFIESSDEMLRFSEDADVHLGGTRYILSQPEFQDPAKIRELINLIEKRQTVYDLVSNGEVEGTTIKVGVQGKRGGRVEELSLLSATYLAGRFKGTVGIIGPTRMPYSRLLGIVDYTAKRLSEVLSE